MVVDIIVNANPHETAFKNRMDDLNRYIDFYRLQSDDARRLREYMYETQEKHRAKSRRAIEVALSNDLQQLVCDIINHEWLDNVPFFAGLTAPDGTPVTVEKSFLAKVATALQSDVFAPGESPPPCRVYTIVKGHARFRGSIRSSPFCWGALDVMLPKAPMVKTAIAATYLVCCARQIAPVCLTCRTVSCACVLAPCPQHVVWIDGPQLREIAVSSCAGQGTFSKQNSSTQDEEVSWAV